MATLHTEIPQQLCSGLCLMNRNLMWICGPGIYRNTVTDQAAFANSAITERPKQKRARSIAGVFEG
jgi:hypothetical protein